MAVADLLATERLSKRFGGVIATAAVDETIRSARERGLPLVGT